MPPGWKPCRRTYRTAPPPRRCRRSATSTSLNSRRSFRPAASAEIDQRDVRSAREPALSRTAPDRPTSPAPHRTALAPAAQPRPAPPGRALPSAPFTRGVNFERRSGVTFRRRLTAIVLDRHRRPHEEGAAHVGASAADEAFALPSAGLARPRRQSPQRGDLAAIERAEFRQPGQQPAGDGRPHARHAFEQLVLLAPDRRGLDRLADLPVEVGELPLQGREQAFDARQHALAGAMLL